MICLFKLWISTTSQSIMMTRLTPRRSTFMRTADPRPPTPRIRMVCWASLSWFHRSMRTCRSKQVFRYLVSRSARSIMRQQENKMSTRGHRLYFIALPINPLWSFLPSYLIRIWIQIQSPMDKPAAKLTLTHRYPKPTLAHKSTLPHASEVMVARFGFEDSLLAAGYSDGHVRLYNLNTDHRILELDTNPSKKEVTPVNCLRWRPMSHEHSTISSVILVANTNGTLIQYLARTGKEVFRTVEEGNLILAMDYAHDGRSFATGGKDNTIRVYDEEKKSITAQLMGIKWHTHGHNNRLQSLRFFPNDANMLASGGWDQNINVWDIRTGNSVATIFGPKIAGDALDVRDNLILSGANRGTDQLQLWDWTMNKVVTKFRWDQEKQITGAFLFAAQFCHHSTDTVMAAGGNQMKIFNLYDGKEVLEAAVSGGVSLYTCDSAYTANKYVMGGNSGSAFYLAEVKNQ